MKVLKIRKRNYTQYKQKCCKCGSKLLIDYQDLSQFPKYVHTITYSSALSFICPICHQVQFLTRTNQFKAEMYLTMKNEGDTK